IGGMTMAIELRRMGWSNFTIIERASEVGGTWRDNIYPGCSSDVAVHLYSLSTDLKSDWTQSHAFQPELKQYWLGLAAKYDLYPNIVFNRSVLSARWNSAAQEYEILTEDRNGTRISLTAAILVSAVGVLEIPRFPDIAGIADFQGKSFHSARWDNTVSLAGKRVAVIGNGASATQYVPMISEDATVQVTQYCRSPRWLAPPIRTQYSLVQKWFLKNVPFYLRMFRAAQYVWVEITRRQRHQRPSLIMFLQAYMMRATPAEYLDQVVPSNSAHKLGCKRVVIDTNYLASLGRPNMSLIWDPIESINEDGILTEKGRSSFKPFDVIIYSTGYITDSYFVDIQGTTEQTVAQYYEAHGGPTAYLGTTLSGFPNFFTIAGANYVIAKPYPGKVYSKEIQVAYIIQIIKPIIDGHISSAEVTSEATDAYNRKIQARLAEFVWSKCHSWYRTGNSGKLHGPFPGPMVLFWWWLRRPNWDHYKVTTTSRWKP
ncbi:hypothetical protein B0H11DRAFT_1726105, partial [Mycena galericulata]